MLVRARGLWSKHPRRPKGVVGGAGRIVLGLRDDHVVEQFDAHDVGGFA